MKLSTCALAVLAVSTPALAAGDPNEHGENVVPVAYEALAAGQINVAIRELTATRGVDADDPSRLINLGTAYARMGQIDRAMEMYRRAETSDIRYDLELADGRTMDSRAAARLALAQVSDRTAARYAGR